MWVALLLVAACGAPMSAGATTGPDLPRTPEALQELDATPVGSSDRTHDALERARRAEARFDRAAEGYAARDYPLAAREFMAAADGFDAPPDAQVDQIFARNRAAAWHNAVAAYRMLDRLDEAARALRDARDRHPADAPVLDTLLGGLRRGIATPRSRP